MSIISDVYVMSPKRHIIRIPQAEKFPSHHGTKLAVDYLAGLTAQDTGTCKLPTHNVHSSVLNITKLWYFWFIFILHDCTNLAELLAFQ